LTFTLWVEDEKGNRVNCKETDRFTFLEFHRAYSTTTAESESFSFEFSRTLPKVKFEALADAGPNRKLVIQVSHSETYEITKPSGPDIATLQGFKNFLDERRTRLLIGPQGFLQLGEGYNPGHHYHHHYCYFVPCCACLLVVARLLLFSLSRWRKGRTRTESTTLPLQSRSTSSSSSTCRVQMEMYTECSV